jgi:hypothetical protein
LSSCAAIKFTAKIKKRKTDANLIFPWGSFISVTSLLWILLRLLDQDEQMKPGLYKRIDTATIQCMYLLVVFLRAAQSPGSQLSVAGVYAGQVEL